MKKLFFAALFATVAVGGAFATSAKFAAGNFYTINATSTDVHCPDGAAVCSLKYPNTVAYSTPAGTIPRGPQVDLEDYNYQP